MKYSCHLLIGLLALLLCGCGTTVKESLKVQTATKRPIGADKTVVILPFADYSNADNLETAYRRNLLVSENLIDQFVSNSFHTPNNDDVFLFLVDQNIIHVVAYENSKPNSVEMALKSDYSNQMKKILQTSLEQSQPSGSGGPMDNSIGTRGLTPQEVVKIGRHFSADYIVRGTIIQFKDRQDPSWSPAKKGVIPFITGVTNKIAFGQAESEQYDTLGNMMAGGFYGATISAVSNGTSTENLVWGSTGAVLGLMAEHTGKIPQAVVQLRVWVQDAYTGNIVWTNRVDVKVSPESVLADYQYDALFEKATEKAIATLVTDFTNTL